MTQDQLKHIERTYKRKKVFLTGHTGFKGSWLLFWLKQLGAEVMGYALGSEREEDLYNQMEGDQFCQSIIGDLRDRDKLIKAIGDFKPDFVFHLAAQPLVRTSYDIPSETFSVNAIGTANVLDGIRNLDQPCVGVMITTDKVYENREWHYPYRETDRLGGYDPYSASKACAELVISSYRNSFFNPHNYEVHQKAIASARAGNVIGGGDWAIDRIIPDIVRALSKNEPIVVRNPRSIRPWQHVLESIGGYLLLGAKMQENPTEFSTAWNFGPLTDDTLDVESLVRKAIDIWGSGNFVKHQLQNVQHEATMLKLDIGKTTSELGWKPKWSAMETIDKTIKWYRNQLNRASPKELMKVNIEEYRTGSN